MNVIMKALIIGALIFYLIKGILYLVLWYTTKRMEKRGLERKYTAREKRMTEKELFQSSFAQDRDDQDEKD